MSISSGFRSNLSITFIGTATAIIEIDGVRFLTDPFFHQAESSVEYPIDATRSVLLKVHHDPGLSMQDLPPIDAVLLSHEDHWDNLDELGRQLLDGRHVLTTEDGAKNLAPRPGVQGMKPWETVNLTLGGKAFRIMATPCKHVPGNECVGFVLTTDDFGTAADGRPNAIYFTGDTVYMEELAAVGQQFHIAAAIMNLGEAYSQLEPLPAPKVQITMGGKQAASLFRDIKADRIVPMHYDAWDHFTQHEEELAEVFESEGVLDKVKWLKLGEPVQILTAES
ncbi:Putative metallo-beta-lactamase, ribonuclease Z/Hydroxyacylglutathione hydrolase [Colletotrichum destructivum]|uniref:Metallo-beta-lactamase, ribonuclease Z/Hydroxyacylglutathione hydrolase n=1 Tax=Colletotrichum destructivum TaxID=34406 RepID=A0AAX4IVF7_9PEZI|nr:Putative metallo-beta-lactamase, ribonuclease Z/Hydroxyacylglutathione hydrolase [Colletotrichum destructivum]